MKKRNKKENIEEENVNETSEVVEDANNTNVEKKGIKKTVFYIFYEAFGLFCLVLFILTLFSGPRNFILDKFNMFLGLVVMLYGVLFLLPYTFKKKETKLINFITFLELGVVILLGFILFANKDVKFLNTSRVIGIVIYVFGLVEIIRGYHSNGGVKIFKSSLLNGFIKYFNIILITVGTYVFFDKPFEKHMIEAIRILLLGLFIVCLFIGILKMPKKKH